MALLQWLEANSALTPHGFCLLWQPGLLWMDAVSDAAIMLAYFSIPLTLLWFARRRPDLPHRWIAVLFVAFIVACGITHGLSILTLWVAAYGIEAIMKMVTALLSITTAIVLWPIVPKLLALPSPAEVTKLNIELRRTLAEQEATATQLRESERRLLLAQETLQNTNAILEQRVAERTGELQANAARLRRNQMFLQRISQIAGVGGWEYDVATQSTSCSAEAYQILGMDPAANPPGDASGKTLAAEAQPYIGAAVARALAGERGWDIEMPRLRDDGQMIWYRTIGSVDLAEDGQPSSITGAIQDITDRVSERTKLQNAHERLSLATASCGIGIWDWDVLNNRILWDDRMYSLYGMEPADANHESGLEVWHRLLHPDDRARTEEDLRRSIELGSPFVSEFRIVWDDGSVRHIQGIGRVERDANGRSVRMVGINWDVTERVATAEMRAERDRADRASRAKSDFLATMSHEIRSPLSGLIGVLDLLRSTDLDAEQGRMAGMIDNSARMLLAVLNDVLDFSKIEAGALLVTLEPVALRPVLEELVQPYRVSAERKGLALLLSIAEDVPEAIESDGVRLRQVLGNLLSNALKFTASGEVALTVRPVHDAAEPTLCFAVRDTGIGMSEAVIAKLFHPFVQADGSTTRLYGGTGLGLSISQRLAGLLHGALSVASTPNAGSEFSLVLPIRVCAAVAAETVAPPALAAPALAELGLHALVVDDDSTIRWLSQRQLEKLGFAVDTANDGADGLQKLLADQYDLLLTDCHMPRMDGVELTRAVRNAALATLRDLPIIGVTADVTDKQRKLCVEAGMSDLAIKPLTIDALAGLVQRHVPSGRCGNSPGEPRTSALQAIPFDDQIYLSIFAPGEPEGVAWLAEYLEGAADDCAELARIAEACRAMPDGLEDLGRLAHRLAGASFSVGATLLGDAARALEQAAAGGDGLQACAARLQAAHRQAEAAIRGFCA